MLNAEQGKKLIDIAREVVWAKIKNKSYTVSSKIKKEFSFNAGCFVTLKRNNELRGCIGYPDPIVSLIEAVVSSAEKAAFFDPRFPPVDEEEFSSISFEISVLSRPKMIMVRNPEEYLKEVHIGRDGLIVKGVWEYGILLPQVALEYKWDSLQFLEQTCQKAGLSRDAWQDFNKCRIYKFQCLVFSESAPNGIVQIILNT